MLPMLLWLLEVCGAARVSLSWPAEMPPASRKLCWLQGERICCSKGLLC